MVTSLILSSSTEHATTLPNPQRLELKACYSLKVGGREQAFTLWSRSSRTSRCSQSIDNVHWHWRKCSFLALVSYLFHVFKYYFSFILFQDFLTLFPTHPHSPVYCRCPSTCHKFTVLWRFWKLLSPHYPNSAFKTQLKIIS